MASEPTYNYNDDEPDKCIITIDLGGDAMKNAEDIMDILVRTAGRIQYGENDTVMDRNGNGVCKVTWE